MNSRVLTIAGALVIVGLGFTLGYLQRVPDVAAVSPALPPAAVPTAPAPETAIAPLPAPAAPSAPTSLLQAEIERICDLLARKAASPGEVAALKAALLDSDPADAIAAIRRFLRSGRDARTGQDFAIGRGGVLQTAPTLRLALLDTLGQIARKIRSADAGAVSREILAEKSSADEWAIALRNIGWTEPQSRAFLAERMREMLRHPAWRETPSDGFLEALDVIVFTKDASFIPDLDEARATGDELAHAADIALDRLAESAPLDVLTFLNAHPARLGDRPFLRADYFAKADLTQPAQREQLEYYLGRSDVSLAEKTKLLGALVTPASFVSNSLLTSPPAPDDGKLRRAALTETAREWLARGRFPQLREPLDAIEQRLSR